MFHFQVLFFLRSFLIAGLLLIASGCSQADAPKVGGPVEGKRLDGAQVADATAEKKTTPPEAPETPETNLPENEKKKRDEWRDKKTGKPDENDPIAQANITLRPSLDPNKQIDKNAADPAAKKPENPTDLVKPLLDPDAENPFFDPNNPDFIPADRNRYKTFDIGKLEKSGGHLVVPFMDLSGFPYTGMVGAPEPAKDGKEPAKPEFTIPDAIKALDGKQVVIAGYMMPIDFEDGGTNEFVLTRQVPSCFYCVPPQLNDWVEVKMKDGKRVPYVPDGLIELYGVIEVGEMKEDGFVVNMYRMTGTKMIESKKE